MAKGPTGRPEPVFLYTSVCCKVPATKGACEMAHGTGVKAFGEKPDGEATLGAWRCTACRKPAKVTRALNPEARVNRKAKHDFAR